MKKVTLTNSASKDIDNNSVATKHRLAEIEKSVVLKRRALRNANVRSAFVYTILICNCVGIASLVGMLKPEHLSDRAYTLCVTMIDIEVVLIFFLAFFLEYSEGRLMRPLYEEASSIWENLATRDSLTGLANRLAFMHSLDEEIAISKQRKKKCAVLFIDLNKFKIINDTYGHAVGDAVIVLAAKRIYQALSPRDLAARLGGDEFAVLMSEVTIGDAQRMAQVIEKSIGEPMEIDGKLLVVSASIGVRATDEKVKRAEEILHEADLKMYKTKAAGRWQRRGAARLMVPPPVQPRNTKS